MIYLDPKDGKRFVGKTARGVVRQMHRAAWLTPPGKGDYMAEVARRLRALRKVFVNPSTAEAFLASLESAGVLIRKE